MDKINFVETFNELLDENGINRKQFAEKSNIPYPTVIGWTNLNRLPDFSALIKIADYFSVSVDYLLGREDEFKNKTYQNKFDEIELLMCKSFKNLSYENKKLILELMQKLENKEK